MKEKIFISFTNVDRELMTILTNVINEMGRFEAYVVERQRSEGAIALSSLVELGIKECQYFVPILTKGSVITQWVNQEIGFAQGLDSIDIIPIVETEIKSELKGFIHDQIQLSYRFSFDKKHSFLDECVNLISDLNERPIKKKSRPESVEVMMKRKEAMPYFLFNNTIFGPPIMPDLQRIVGQVFFKNISDNPASIWKIEYINLPESTHGFENIIFPTPKLIASKELLEIEVELIKKMANMHLEVLITFFDKYDNRYHQLVGYKSGKAIKSGPVIVKLAVT